MQVILHKNRLFEVVDQLLALKAKNLYPFNRTDAVVPQTLIGEDIRRDKRALSLFYFYACIYMRGGIVSSTAFKLLLKMRGDFPWMFEPSAVVAHPVAEIQAMLKRYIGWDYEKAGEYWHENSRLLLASWGGSPMNIIEATRNYDDALNFYVNKNKKGSRQPKTPYEILTFDQKSVGFWGHQHKMASMQVYFADWERLYPKRFLYPGPVDFHNYRIFLTTGTVQIDTSVAVNFSEKVSKPLRGALVEYMKKRKQDPIDIADVLWLFSLLMCGESPHTQTKEQKLKPLPLLSAGQVEESWRVTQWSQGKMTALNRSCHVCAFNESCKYAIPAGPYYGKRGDRDQPGGKLVLRQRPPLASYLKPHQIDPSLINAPLEGDAAIMDGALLQHESRKEPAAAD